MFRTVTIYTVVGVVALALLHFLLAGRKVSVPSGGTKVRRYNIWERLVHLALTVSFLVLAVTGFAEVLEGHRMEGFMLMIHATFAPVFACSVAAMMITWAGDCRFASHDLAWLQAGGCCCSCKEVPAGRFSGGQKVLFWLTGLLTLVLALSMVACMFPLFDEKGMVLMLRIHRCSALLLVVVMLMHAYATLLVRRGGFWALVTGKVSSEWAKRFHPLW